MFSATLPQGARIVILGTGGTIAGTGHDPARPWAYQAAQLGVGQLLASLLDGVPALRPWGAHLVAEQVAQVDSKDMGWPVWQALGAALQRHLADPSVLGVVITHGTDTLEETAALLHWLAPATKPIVLTAAMRPATAVDADGPSNLALSVATVASAHRSGQGGVVACLQGRVWSARDVRKAHSHALDAFDGGGVEPLRDAAPWPVGPALGWSWLQAPQPRVAMLTSHADAHWEAQALRQALRARAQGELALDGVLVACTGHGTVHEALDAALQEAAAAGVVIWRSSRVAQGGVVPRDGDRWPAAGHWTAAQARLALQLHLMGVPAAALIAA